MATLKVTNIKNESFAGDQLYLKTDGKIGIGTTNPLTKLHIEDDSSDGGFYFRRTNGTIMAQIFGDGTSTNARQLMYSGGAGKISLNTAGVSYFNGGNLGLGTTSPTAQLDVRRTDADGKIAEFHQNSGYGVDIGSSQADAYISSGYNQKFHFKTDAAGGAGQETRLVIDPAGLLWIGGTTVPSGDTRYLNIISTAAKESSISFSRSNSLGGNTCGQTIRLDTTGNLVFAVHNVGTKFTLKSDGNVEIVENLKANNLSGRNLIINGACQIAQRLDLATAQSGYGAVDRYQLNSDGAGRWTLSRDNESPDSSGLRDSLKFETTTADSSVAAGDYMYLVQKLEGYDVQSIQKGFSTAKQVTLQFWIRLAVTGTYVVQLFDTDNSRHVVANYTVSSANTWEKKTITFPADTTGDFANDKGGSLEVRWHFLGGSTYRGGTQATTWAGIVPANMLTGMGNAVSSTGNNYLSGIQLEIGTIATEFEHKSYGDELRRCQRYYHKVQGDSGDRVGIGGYAVGSTEARFDVFFPETMRSNPTLDYSGTAQFDANDDSADFNLSDITIDSTPTGSISSLGLQIVTSGMTAGQSGGLRFRSNSSFLSFIAEL